MNSHRLNDPKNNPCVQEAQASYSCMSKYNYNASKCQKYFQAYRDCKRMMNKVKAERRTEGLKPCPEDWTKEDKFKK